MLISKIKQKMGANKSATDSYFVFVGNKVPNGGILLLSQNKLWNKYMKDTKMKMDSYILSIKIWKHMEIEKNLDQYFIGYYAIFIFSHILRTQYGTP